MFNQHYVDPNDPLEKRIIDKINIRWTQFMMECHNIVPRTQSGKLMVGPKKQQEIERAVAFHLGELKRGFDSEELSDNLMVNFDETHFIINSDNGKTLGFVGDDKVRYSDVVSGGEGMTMVVRIVGGLRGKVHIPFMIFKNPRSSYPINTLDDNVRGVAYRSSPKGFMNGYIFNEYFKEKRIWKRNRSDQKLVVYCDNVPCHSLNSEIGVKVSATVEKLGAELRFLPANSTHLSQPCDSFVIQKIKEIWTGLWEKKKLELVNSETFTESGKLPNPGKRYFLELAAEAVRRVNLLKDRNGLSYARKAMIRCGMGLDNTGIWNEGQLNVDLQEVVRKHRSYFEGNESSTSDDE
ncbi:hypothetical protein GEMRC1_013664 [Eukaryota sp. GEM-RC1]